MKIDVISVAEGVAKSVMGRVALASACGLAAALLALAPEPSHAQMGCTAKSIPASTMSSAEVDLYSTDRRFAKTVAASSLGASVDVMDCNDPVYFGIEQDGAMFLVRRSVFRPRTGPATSCYCPSAAAEARERQLAAPGLAPPRQCPANECTR